MPANRADIVQLLTSVSHYLRERHGLKRLQAEWMCFRFIGVTIVMDMEDKPPIVIAQRLFDLWSEYPIQSEFNVLLRGVSSPQTTESNNANPRT